MKATGPLQERYGRRFDALARAFQSGSGPDFERELDALLHERERGLFVEIGSLSRDLQDALERFTFDARIVDLAEKDVPDARQRLAHVLKLTDEAAHRTMDLVEDACPRAERTASDAAEIAPLWEAYRARRLAAADSARLLERLDRFVLAAGDDAGKIRANLGEVLLAQGYQDLTGQIIRSVMHLVEEVELALGNLVILSAGAENAPRDDRAVTAAVPSGAGLHRGFGPPVPGVQHGTVVGGQDDVDALLSGLGM